MSPDPSGPHQQSAPARRLFLVGGHESGDGADLVRLERLLPYARAVSPGRRLHDAVAAALAEQAEVVVVPMTFGRDPALVADAARTLRWLARRDGGSLALAAPFGTADHCVARLRAAVGAVRAADPGAAVVITAHAADPFDDAELHRLAHLVRVHGAGAEVAVATTGARGDVAAVLARQHRLGFARCVLVPADFSASPELADPVPGTSAYGPLLGDAAIVAVVAARESAARHDLRHGQDGITAGLTADHDHGYAHSHAGAPDEHGHPHSHPHPHSHEHPHEHPHPHAPERTRPGPHPVERTSWPTGNPATTTAPTPSSSTRVVPA